MGPSCDRIDASVELRRGGGVGVEQQNIFKLLLLVVVGVKQLKIGCGGSAGSDPMAAGSSETKCRRSFFRMPFIV